MGAALAVALGIAAKSTDRDVVAILGDGELLMGAGSLWSMAGLAPTRLTAVVLADGKYTITGSQPLVCAPSFAALAGQLDGITSAGVRTAAELGDAVREARGPTLIEALIDEARWPGPSPFVDPARVMVRFAAAVRGGRDPSHVVDVASA
jgi:thiamine pyrophosphate-dependent acetolactate synthase large subunit-like protein